MILTLAAVLASLQTPLPADPAAVTRGHRLARTGCAQCHAVEPSGSSANAYAPPFRDLLGFEPGRSIDEVFARGILVSHAGMPRFGLREAEQADLLAYIRTLQPRQER